MKKTVKVLLCLSASFLMSTAVFAEKIELYALDGRSLFVDEGQVEIYTAEGMGWYIDKPVTMYAQDGRTIVIPADKVDAYKNVGWFLKDELDGNDSIAQPDSTDSSVTVTPDTDTSSPAKDETIFVKYTDGTVVKVPTEHLKMYEALGWVKADGSSSTTVTMYNSDGVAKEVPADEVEKYKLAGWVTTAPAGEYVTLYYHDGTTKEVLKSSVESYKAQGWYSAYDEAVYAYAAFGDGGENPGAVALLENKKYELAFNTVQDAVDKIENTESEYVSMLYYLRSTVTDTWREAANSPLGFINYWFNEKDGKRIIVFEYRNISNSRIQSFRINFDICDKDGNVIETNSGSYFVNNLQMTPCEKKRVAWIIKSGEEAASIKNLKVNEVVFSDGTSWRASN